MVNFNVTGSRRKQLVKKLEDAIWDIDPIAPSGFSRYNTHSCDKNMSLARPRSAQEFYERNSFL